MKIIPATPRILGSVFWTLALICGSVALRAAVPAQKPLKVFILAGDEDMLRQGSIDGVARGPGKKKSDSAEPLDKPGTLLKIIQENPRFAFLKDAEGKWAQRNDVAIYDAHPLSNNTRDPARLLQVPSDPADPRGFGVGDLSPKVNEFVLAMLKAREDPSCPLPRVLFIGDSITGSYWEKVQKNLDGKAFVAKNPGNGKHSGTGARLINQWVDLKQYFLNGQEYLELIDDVNQTLKDLDRYCPDFTGRPPELAGFVWFQVLPPHRRSHGPSHARAIDKTNTNRINV